MENRKLEWKTEWETDEYRLVSAMSSEDVLTVPPQLAVGESIASVTALAATFVTAIIYLIRKAPRAFRLLDTELGSAANRLLNGARIQSHSDRVDRLQVDVDVHAWNDFVSAAPCHFGNDEEGQKG